MLRSYEELNKGLQAIATRGTEFSKQVFEDATQTFEKLVDVKSLDQALEIQSEYARKAYDRWMAEASKFSEMYADMARGAHKPVEQAVERKVA